MPDTTAVRPPHPFPGESTPGTVFWAATVASLGLVAGALLFGWTLFGWAPAAGGGTNMGDQFELAEIQLVAWAGLGLAGACGLVLVVLPWRPVGPSDARRTRTAGVKLACAGVVGVTGLVASVWAVTGRQTRRDAAVTGQLRDAYWELLGYAGLGASVLAAIVIGRVLWGTRRR